MTLDATQALTDDPLRRLARAILGGCLLLFACMAGLGAALHGPQRDTGAVPRQWPLPKAVRLRADTITVVAATDDAAAPASGVTGTTALPALPVSIALADRIVAGESGVVPARPFAIQAASTTDRSRALQCLTAAVYYEAGSEADAGQQAVAQVVLNRVRHPAFPATVCGVVYQGSERAGCQFSFACDGATARGPSPGGWAHATQVAAMALAGRVFAPVGLATHYHTYAATPAWNRALVMTDVVGAHFFHRWKGYWGTAAAFSQRYRGGEPLPQPRQGATIAPPVTAMVPITLPAVTGAVTPAGALVPAPHPGGASLTGADTEDGQILPQWRESGKPLVQ